MAVAELPSHALAIPRRHTRARTGGASAPNLAWIPLVGVLLGIASLFYVAQTSEVAVMGYDIQQLQTEVDSWQMRNEQLSLELAKAKSLPVIEAQATDRLHMVPARDPIFLKAAPISGEQAASRNRSSDLAVPELEKSARAATDPLNPVLSSVSVLIPRGQPAPR